MAIKVTTTEIQDHIDTPEHILTELGWTEDNHVWLPGCRVNELRRSDWQDRATWGRAFKAKYPDFSMELTKNPGHTKTTVYIFQCEESYQEFLAFEKFDEPETLEILRQCHRTATRVTEII
jgi:hypothetical protein